jgi:hypothetical protein
MAQATRSYESLMSLILNDLLARRQGFEPRYRGPESGARALLRFGPCGFRPFLSPRLRSASVCSAALPCNVSHCVSPPAHAYRRPPRFESAPDRPKLMRSFTPIHNSSSSVLSLEVRLFSSYDRLRSPVVAHETRKFPDGFTRFELFWPLAEAERPQPDGRRRSAGQRSNAGSLPALTIISFGVAHPDPDTTCRISECHRRAGRASSPHQQHQQERG